MDFTIVIPTYNRADKLKETILSALHQDFTGEYEVVVIDDGSTDDTRTVIAEIEDPRLTYHFQQNAERGAARNHGVQKAKGQYVTFLDSDDILYPLHLSEAIKMTRQGHSVFWLPYEELDGDSRKRIRLHSGPQGKEAGEALVKNGNFMSCHGVFAKRSILLETTFREDRELSGSEDWELWLRIASRYEIGLGNTVSHALLNHADRSVFNFPRKALIERFKKLEASLRSDSKFMERFGKELHFIRGESQSYIALHGMMSQDFPVGLAVSYFLRSVRSAPQNLFRRRTLAIVKHLLLRIVR